jgi:vanillate O-demethylase monooxygenase subunit
MPGKSRYLFSSGYRKDDPVAQTQPEMVEKNFEVVMAAFAEDRIMIEAQQKIWDMTPEDRKRAFIPQDKAPSVFRRMIKKRIEAENNLVAIEE